jgi:hypothetical protein
MSLTPTHLSRIIEAINILKPGEPFDAPLLGELVDSLQDKPAVACLCFTGPIILPGLEPDRSDTLNLFCANP